MLDRTIDCEEFEDKDIRKRCERRNVVIMKYADELLFLSKVIAQADQEIDLLMKEMNDYTMKGILPPIVLENKLDEKEQNKSVRETERYIKESERDIAVTEIDLDVKEGELMAAVKDQLKKTGKTLANRAKVGEVLSEVRKEYEVARGITPIRSTKRLGARDTREPTIDQLLRLEARGAKMHPDWQKRIDAYKQKKGISTSKPIKQTEPVNFEDDA